MEIKMSSRDKKLLLFLAIFLIVVGFGKLIILPGLSHYQELETEIMDRQMEKDEMEMAIIGYPMLETEYEELKKQLDVAYEDCYPLMTSQEIDRRLTSIILEEGAEAVSLDIDVDDTQGLTMKAYGVSEEDVLEEAPEEEQSDRAEKLDEASAELEDEPVVDEATGEALPPGVKSARVSLVAEGSRERLNRILDIFVTERPGIHVNSYSFSEREDQAGAVSSLNLEMYVYMFGEESLNDQL